MISRTSVAFCLLISSFLSCQLVSAYADESLGNRRFVSFGKVTFQSGISGSHSPIYSSSCVSRRRGGSSTGSLFDDEREVRSVSTASIATPAADESIDTEESVSSPQQHGEGDTPFQIIQSTWTHFTANLPSFGDFPCPPFLRQPGKVSACNSPQQQTTESLVQSLTQPLIAEDVWNKLTGTEFQEHPETLEALTIMGEQIALNDAPNEWIDWQVFGGKANAGKLEEGEIHVWTGRCIKEGCYYGSQLPFIKTRSIIPLSVDEMVELMMDSTRVQTYNPWSLGRRDCWVQDDHTKIVKNRVQPPLGSKAMVSTTFLHARPAVMSAEGDWVVVSRSIGGICFAEPDDAEVGRSDILLGVNLLQPVDDESCTLTAITHVYSSMVPTMLAERLGVKSAIKFVKDMRGLKVAAE